ncbi:MAG: alpha-2-macroglobulin family protein, partial [Planctomycetota bacterium]
MGGVRCHNLIQQIEARELQISTERVWTAPPPSIHVSYRNITQLNFRVVAWNVDEFLKSRRYSPSQLDQAERSALLAKAPLLAWSAPLKPTDDYQTKTVDLPANLDLKPGSYFLIASADPQFGQDDNLINFAEFWVSDLAVVVRNFHGQGFIEGFVLEARTGEPIANASVRSWSQRGQLPRTPGMPVKTDANGLFRLDDVLNTGALLDVTAGPRRLVTGQSYGAYAQQGFQEPIVRTFFFTDRSIYRPGQTIQYKGVSVFADQQADKYASYANQPVTVALVDVNGKEVERQVHRTNAFGSTSGSFTAPRDRLLGAMRITVVEGRAAGDAVVRVEEYKRPKFQVALEAPAEPARLAREVSLQGKATAYTGAAIDNAKVKWRVVRRVRFPDWWIWRCWWMPPQPDRSQEIAHGTAVTDAGGAFTIKFLAKPDLSVDEDSEPRFSFAVTADVTDGAGETRSADRLVTVGYTALAASLSADDWQQIDNPVAVRVRAESLDGEGRVAEGVLKVYRVEQPADVKRSSLNEFQPPMPFPRAGRGRGIQAGGNGNVGGKKRVAGKLPPEGEKPPTDPSRPESWPLGPLVHEQGVTTAASGAGEASVKLPEGYYRAKYETRDAFGKAVTAELPFRVLAPAADKLGLKVPDLFAAPKWTAEPGEEFSAVWGTGYAAGRAYVEFEHRGKVVERFWTPAGKTQIAVKKAVTEAMRGGFTIRVTHVQENRAYLHSRRVDVPWSNKRLSVRWERFVSKLEPNEKVTWTAVVTGPDAKKAAAELVAGLYDASLDVFAPHSWIDSFGVFRTDQSNVHSDFDNRAVMLQYLLGQWRFDYRGESLRYRGFPAELLGAFMPQMGRTMMFRRMAAPGNANGMPMMADAAPMAAMAAPMAGGGTGGGANAEKLRALSSRDEFAANKAAADGADRDAAGEAGPGGAATASGPDLGKVAARKNLQETAFFFPTLVSNSDGEARIEFTIPEALTEWKFLGFAHDSELRSGLLTDKAVTAKELMVQPNPPRFAREGDTLEFTVKVSNQSATRQTGKARLALADARTGSSVDAAFGNRTVELEFDVPSKESRTLAWRLAVPDDASFVTYKVVGAAGRVSDGEEGMLPVLSRRILVTESLPLPIRGKQTKEFVFDRLVKSGQSDTLKHKTLRVQMVSNPSWYAVMALPYLMEFPHECTEQSFNRLYANALARHIAASDPKIRRVFDQWKGTPSLDSPLTKNQDLKAVMLEETPWVRDADAESQASRNVGILFDDNRLNDETQRLMAKLAESQLEDGAWPWFPGGRGNDYITLYITTGFGRLRHLGVKLDMGPAIRSLDRLDTWADQMYRDILKNSKDKNTNHLSTTIALYLYCRGFFLEDKPVAPEKKEAVDYWLGQAKRHWLALGERQSQAHLALALRRFGDPESAKGIGRSLEERSVSSEEMGKFWRDTELSWWWYRAP